MLDNVVLKSLFLGVFTFFLFTFINSSIIVNKLKEERKFIEVDGITVSYKEAGKEHIKNGAIIFLHGFSGSANDWDFLIQETSKFYYCVAIDIPPFGLSEKSPKTNYSDQNTLNLLANVIKLLTNKLSIEKFVLVGHSMGGYFSIKLVTQIGEKIEKIILIDAAYNISNISNRDSLQFSLSHSEVNNLSVLL
ncbi:MAG: alpha/beta fold hydrolase, partial [Fervidobacterium sp.]